MAVAGQGVVGGGPIVGVPAKDMFRFPFYRDERTCVCQIANPKKHPGLGAGDSNAAFEVEVIYGWPKEDSRASKRGRWELRKLNRKTKGLEFS